MNTLKGYCLLRSLYSFSFPVPFRAFVNKMPETIGEIEFIALKEKVLDCDVTIIDVREPEELKETGKIPNSVNIPVAQIENAFKLSNDVFKSSYGISKPNKEDASNVVLSCKSGRRATTVHDKLQNLGYKNMLVYKGSFQDWVLNGGPIDNV